MNLVRVKSVAVFSVMSLVAAFLVTGGSGNTAAQAAPKELTTFEILPNAPATEKCTEMPPGSGFFNGGLVKNGVGKMKIHYPELDTRVEVDITDVKATATKLTFTWVYGTTVLTGKDWGPYSGTFRYEWDGHSCALTIRNMRIKNPPSVGKKPRAPKSAKVVGSPSAKSFKVLWTKPSTKGKRTFTGYRLTIKAQGASKFAVNKKLAKKKTSFKVKRSTLLKSLRSSARGEANVRFNVRVYALNGNARSTAAKSTIWVRP